MKSNPLYVRFIATLLLGLFVALNVNAGMPAPEPEDDDLPLMVVPTIVAGLEDPLPPEWGVSNLVCCPSSSATFTVRQGNQVQSSTLPTCQSAEDFSGFKVSTEGTKSFSSTLTAQTCPNLTSNFSFPFENDTRYVFVLEFENQAPVINVLFGPIPKLASKKLDSDSIKTMKKLNSYIYSGETQGWSKLESGK